tara:strand:+ start:1993 stop:2664 length:672 start_codon:yes stop_codon:yes gene_type:complete
MFNIDQLKESLEVSGYTLSGSATCHALLHARNIANRATSQSVKNGCEGRAEDDDAKSGAVLSEKHNKDNGYESYDAQDMLERWCNALAIVWMPEPSIESCLKRMQTSEFRGLPEIKVQEYVKWIRDQNLVFYKGFDDEQLRNMAIEDAQKRHKKSLDLWDKLGDEAVKIVKSQLPDESSFSNKLPVNFEDWVKTKAFEVAKRVHNREGIRSAYKMVLLNPLMA